MAVGMSMQISDDEVVLRAECVLHNGGDYAEVIKTYALHHGCQQGESPLVGLNGEKCVFFPLQSQSISQPVDQSISKSISWSKMIPAPIIMEHALWMLCVLSCS